MTTTTRVRAGLLVLGSLVLSGGTAVSPAIAFDIRAAIKHTLEANPKIGQAIANREAIQFEREQANGLFLPKADLVGIVGNTENRNSITGDRSEQTREAGLFVSQLLFDGFETRAENEFQAARVDGASHRVYERSEFIALSVVRQYLEVGLQQRILSLSLANLRYLKNLRDKLESDRDSEATSDADRQQARERVFQAEARIVEARERLKAAKIRFRQIVGRRFTRYTALPNLYRKIPANIAAAIGRARGNSPTVKIAKADLDAAYALLKKARSQFMPKVTAEGRARVGEDLDGENGLDEEYRAAVVMRWNIFKGGIDDANRQEQLRRIDEQRFKLHDVYRTIEEAVRLSWDRRAKQAERLQKLLAQLRAVRQLISSYADQFKIGKRSLLDVLDTQNAKLNAEVQVASAEAAVKFANYRVLAAIGELLHSLGIAPPKEVVAYARDEHRRYPATPDAETERRRLPRDGWVTKVIRY